MKKISRRFVLGLGAGAVATVVLRPFRALANPTDTPRILVHYHLSGGADAFKEWFARFREGEDKSAIRAARFGEARGQSLTTTHGPFTARIDAGVNEFLAKYWKHLVMMACSGPDNGHMLGTLAAATGSTKMGTASLAALNAGTNKPTGAIPYVVSSASAEPGNPPAAPVAVLGDLEQLGGVVDPNRIIGGGGNYFHPDLATQIDLERRAMIERAQAEHYLPTSAKYLSLLLGVEHGLAGLQHLAEELGNGQGVIELLVTLMKGGVVESVTIGSGPNFDTHGGGEQAQHSARMASALSFLGTILDRVNEEEALRKIVVILATSDFSRPPFFNGNKGADHWKQLCVFLLWALDLRPTILGGADEAFYALPVDPKTGVPKAGGVSFKVADVHALLRHYLGVSPKLAKPHKLTGVSIDPAAMCAAIRA